MVGGGLAGFSAAHTILEYGGRAVVLDKSPFCGGNSTKATYAAQGLKAEKNQIFLPIIRCSSRSISG